MLDKKIAAKGTKLIAELVMIVVGINIALWFESVFDDREDARTERQYLEGIESDLIVDLKQLEELIQSNQKKSARLQEIISKLPKLNELSTQEQAEALFEPSSYLFFQPSDFTYLSMQESGDFRLLSDTQIKEGLLRLIRHYRYTEVLQQNFIQAMDDEYIPLMMRSYDIVESRITDPALLERQTFRNFFAFTLQDTSGRVTAYELAHEYATSLLEHVRTQLEAG